MEKGSSFDGPYISLIRKNIYYLNILNSKSKNTPKMEKGSSFDEPYIMKKNIIKFCYVYIISHLP